MKKIFGNIGSRVRQNWRNVMDSTKRKMSTGAQYIATMIPWSRGDNWRRQESKKHKKD
jgi:hypothetical protein